METNYVELLNELWHTLIKLPKYIEFEHNFSRLQGITTLEISVLNAVSEKPDIIFKEICDTLNIPKSTLTNAVDRLEKRKYLYRVISHRDRRSFGLELTDEGRAAQEEHLKFEFTLCSTILNALDNDNERELLLNLLGKILNNLGKRVASSLNVKK